MTPRTFPILSPADSRAAAPCSRCDGGTKIPDLGRPVYNMSRGGCDWIEVLWQGYDVTDEREVVQPLTQMPSLVACYYAVPGPPDGDGRGAPTFELIATLRSHIWGRGDHALITTLSDRLPDPVDLVVADVRVWTCDELWACFTAAVAALCELFHAGDERVLAHFPPDRAW